MVLSIIASTVTIMQFLISLPSLLRRLFYDSDQKASIKALKGLSRECKSNLVDGTFRIIFRDDSLEKINVFYHKVRLRKIQGDYQRNDYKKYSSINLLRGSYLLTADAGNGKSTLLKKFFRISKTINIGSFVFFFDSNKIKEMITKQNTRHLFVENIKAVKPRKVILFLDGLDELEKSLEENMNDRLVLSNFIKDVRSSTNNLEIRATCRERYAEKNNIKECLFIDKRIKPASYFKIDNWLNTKNSIYSFCKKIIRNKWYKKAVNSSETYFKEFKCKNNIMDLLKYIKNYKNELFTKDYISTPLFLVMFLKIVSYNGTKGIISQPISKYHLTHIFVSLLIKSHLSDDEKIKYEAFIDDFAIKYLNGQRMNYSDINNEMKSIISPIIKNDYDGTRKNKSILFNHKIFVDYFVSCYYIKVISAPKVDNEKIINVLKNFYPNDIADMITSYIKNESDENKKRLMLLLIKIYKCTTVGLFESDIDFDINLNQRIISKNITEVLYIKNEVIFRLGRFFFTDSANVSVILDFLKYIYYNDTYILYKGSDRYEKKRLDFFLVYLKRWVAISESYSGGTVCELDYLKKAAECNDNDYDLANRTYTMVYYGDVYKDIFEWQDSIKNNKFKNSFEKRLERLSHNYDFSKLNKDKEIHNWNESVRHSRFRPFDLVGVYTIIMAKKLKGLDKIHLSSLMKTDFSYFNDNEEMLSFLEMIKSKILGVLSNQG